MKKTGGLINAGRVRGLAFFLAIAGAFLFFQHNFLHLVESDSQLHLGTVELDQSYGQLLINSHPGRPINTNSAYVRKLITSLDALERSLDLHFVEHHLTDHAAHNLVAHEMARIREVIAERESLDRETIAGFSGSISAIGVLVSKEISDLDKNKLSTRLLFLASAVILPLVVVFYQLGRIGNLVTSRTVDRDRLDELEKIYDAALDSIIVANESSIIERVNPEITRALGYEPKDLVGKNISCLMGEVNAKIHDEYVSRYLDTGKAAIIGKGREVLALHKSGRMVPVDLAINDITVNGKRKFVGILRDVSERKIHEKNLLVARNEAEKGNRTKTEFLAIMGHELRTPMNGVIGMLSLLKDKDVPDSARQYIERAFNSAQTLQTVINDIFDFVRIDSHENVSLESVSFDPRFLMSEIFASFKASMDTSNKKLNHLVSARVPTYLKGDPSRLREILNQIIRTLLKYPQDGEIVIKIDAVAATGTAVTVRFDVIDYGRGIQNQELESIFGLSGESGDGVIKNRYGVGLGLAFCKKLVGIMGGRIGVSGSTADHGALWFELPFDIATLEGVEARSMEEIGGIRAILYGQEPGSQLQIRGQLALLGIQTIVLGDEKKLVSVLENEATETTDIDVVLIDMELQPYLQLQEAHPFLGEVNRRIPFVLLTNTGQRGDAQLAKEYGFSGYLSKPLTRQNLDDALRVILDRGTRGAAGEIVTRHMVIEHENKVDCAVLVAEENRDDQLSILQCLAEQGMRADTVDDGGAAMEAIESKKYDLIILNLKMSVVDGFEAALRIRAMEKTKKLDKSYIIGLSANTNNYILSRCDGVGIDHCIARNSEETSTSLKDALKTFAINKSKTA